MKFRKTRNVWKCHGTICLKSLQKNCAEAQQSQPPCYLQTCLFTLIFIAFILNVYIYIYICLSKNKGLRKNFNKDYKTCIFIPTVYVYAIMSTKPIKKNNFNIFFSHHSLLWFSTLFLTLCRIVKTICRNKIKFFVTGGVGGVHRDGENSMDVSSDLREFGRTPVTVICAGVKSILDIEKTLQYLVRFACNYN